jgi:hypothetical protein
MTIEELIKKLQNIQTHLGNVDVFDAHYQEAHVFIEDNTKDRFEPDWNMPAMFVRIGYEP